MQDYMYSAIGAVAIAVQLIIDFRVMFMPEKSSIQKAAKRYRFLLLAMFCYFITDVLWGIFAGLNWIPLLFVDTTLYYVAMSAAVVCFYHYIVEYLEIKGWLAKFFIDFGIGFFVAEIISLVINFFWPCFFWFDENDAYVAGVIRYIALWTQVGMFAFSSIMTGAVAFTSKGSARKRHLAIFFFSFSMLVAILFQEKYPLLPFYALGCLIGSCILHVYVVEDEREDYRKIIAEEKNHALAASQAKTDFLFNMSHDIRTPMNAILGYTDIAVKHRDDPERVDESLEKIKVAGGHLLNLINDILEMSRIESGTLEISEDPMNVVKLIEGVEQMSSSLAIDKSIDLKRRLAASGILMFIPMSCTSMKCSSTLSPMPSSIHRKAAKSGSGQIRSRIPPVDRLATALPWKTMASA